MQPAKKLSPVIAALIVIVLVGITVAVVVIAKQQERTEVSETIQTEKTSVYIDGSYAEKGRYITPGGAESIDVTLTIANNVITSVTVEGNTTRTDTAEYQAEFISGYKSLVVGKDIDTVSLSRVAGSSLTSNGFNAALELIKADAQA